MSAIVSALCDAASKGDSDRVLALINDGVDVNGVEDVPFLWLFNKLLQSRPCGKTALYAASYVGNLQMARLLINNGANVNKASNDNTTALYAASTNGHLEVVNLLIEEGANVNVHATGGCSPLWIASQHGHFAVAKTLIENGSQVDRAASERSNFTSLCIAADIGHFEIAKLLIENGADVQARTQFNNSPLHIACSCGRKDIVLLLIEHGANVNAVNDHNETSLHAAIHRRIKKNRDLIEILLLRAADVEVRNRDGLTAWEKADANRQSEIRELILSWQRWGKPLLTQFKDGTQEDTSILNAANSGNADMVMSLVIAGHDVNERDQFARTPLFVASKNGHRKTVQVLLDNGADINAKNKTGATPLFAAAYENHESVVELLIERGANQNQPNMFGITPAYLLKVSKRAGEELSNDTYVQDKNLIISLPSVSENSTDFHSKNQQKDQFTYVMEVRRKKVSEFFRKFRKTSDYISEIETKLTRSYDDKNRSLEHLRSKYFRTLEQKREKSLLLQSKIDEMEKYTRNLSVVREKELEEFAQEVGHLHRVTDRLEGAKTLLKVQVEDLKKESNEALAEVRRKRKRELETLRIELLEEGERRVLKLESRVHELEHENSALLEKHLGGEDDIKQLSMEFEEYRNISQSSVNVDASVSIKKVVSFKGAAGLFESTNELRDKLLSVSESGQIMINNIWSSGNVTGSITGDIENIVVNH